MRSHGERNVIKNIKNYNKKKKSRRWRFKK